MPTLALHAAKDACFSCDCVAANMVVTDGSLSLPTSYIRSPLYKALVLVGYSYSLFNGIIN
jgi:hypothetical protein